MAKKTKTSFGARYDIKIKKKYVAVKDKAKTNSCIFCEHKQVNRIASGIWICSKCGAKFTGKAYSTQQKTINAPVV
ncbi:MAG: 50S ribosomal protein L37ae [Euryarchaeota archaeon HGW-Euryarchaeota-1]|nr:MAG: 50S ribosomal protein L37ae [Euryarchaeota archaeon HGW-Euryarchaeota-1]